MKHEVIYNALMNQGRDLIKKGHPAPASIEVISYGNSFIFPSVCHRFRVSKHYFVVMLVIGMVHINIGL